MISITPIYAARQCDPQINWVALYENLFLAYADSEGPDQPAHQHSLIKAFAANRIYDWRTKARMRPCACAECVESARIAHIQRHIFLDVTQLLLTLLKGLNTLDTFPTISTNVCDFLFAVLHASHFLKRNLFQTEIICSQ